MREASSGRSTVATEGHLGWAKPARMDKKATSFLALGLLVGCLLTAGAFSLLSRWQRPAADGAGSSSALVLRLAHVLDQTHPVHTAMEYLAERLAAKSNGSVRLEIFPNGQLGSETESIEQLQSGALSMVKTSAATMEGFVPDMALFGLPYLFRDEEHYWKVLKGPIGEELLLAGTKVGLRGICYYDSGSRSFYTTAKPVLTPADLEAQKIRVVRSRMAMDLISQLGGAPTPISWGELYTALQQGMVDGAENNPPSLLTSRHFEVAKHYSLDEHTRIPDILLFSDAIWQSLSLETRRWIREAADESVEFERKLWREKTDEALRELEQAGVRVHRPDAAPFRKKVQPMYEKLGGGPLGALVERVRAVN